MKLKSLSDTSKYAAEMALQITDLSDNQCIFLLLNGELGAGKTTFTQSLGKHLGIVETISSPSYVYMKEYSLTEGKNFIHLDAWRILESSDFEALAVGSFAKPGNIIVVEWPKNFLSEETLGMYAKVNKTDITAFKLDFEVSGGSRVVESNPLYFKGS